MPEGRHNRSPDGASAITGSNFGVIENILVLAWRDLSVRYKQTIIVGINSTVPHNGGFYHNFRPHCQIALGGTAPYALMVFAGMLPGPSFRRV